MQYRPFKQVPVHSPIGYLDDGIPLFDPEDIGREYGLDSAKVISAVLEQGTGALAVKGIPEEEGALLPVSHEQPAAGGPKYRLSIYQHG
jgi:hypothetical protein